MNIEIVSVNELEDRNTLRASIIVHEINGEDPFDFFINVNNYLESNIAKYIMSNITNQTVKVISYAPSKDSLCQSVRNKRNSLLESSDKYMTSDYPITDTQREEIKVYRQALRNITKQNGFPENIIWPDKPSILK